MRKILLTLLALISFNLALARASTLAPKLNGPEIVGTRVGTPFLHLIPGVGASQFSARGLPPGLHLNSETGVISGVATQLGTFEVQLTAKNNRGRAKRKFKIVVGEHALALTPAMGWNSWNVWGCDIDDAKIRAAADNLVQSGLAAHGFQYVNVDDCWQGTRDADGVIHSDPKRFPDMKALADYVHGKGLKFGIYSSPGPKTCQNFEGSLHHEQQDAVTYAQWGVDYLKYDWCSYRGDAVAPYALMGKALASVSRDIVYSLCQYGAANVWEWGASVGGNSWRTTGDIEDTWKSLVTIGFSQNGLESYAGPGHWNDPDMLVVGKLGWGPDLHSTRLTQSEQITHISLWGMLAAPLLIGADLSQLDTFTTSLLTNDEVIAIDQDALGIQAKRVVNTGKTQVWARPLVNHEMAVALFNLSKSTQMVSVEIKDLGLEGPQNVRDLWRHLGVPQIKERIQVPVAAHGVVLLKLIPPRK